jgi:hypothetical protein
MPHLLIAGLVAAGGWYAWKALKREMSRIDREVEAVRTPPSETLERDPDTGRYRVLDEE